MDPKGEVGGVWKTFNYWDGGMSWNPPPWVLVQVHHTEVLLVFPKRPSPLGVTRERDRR